MPVWCHSTSPPCLTPLISKLLDTVGWAGNKLGCSKNTAPPSPIFATEAKIQQGVIEGNPSAGKSHINHYKNHANGCVQEEFICFFKIQLRTLENHVLYVFLIHVVLLGVLKYYFPSVNNETLPSAASTDTISTFSCSFRPPQSLHTPPQSHRII